MFLQSTQKPQPKEHIMEENLISCVTKVSKNFQNFFLDEIPYSL